ncbi:Uncharacterised protein [Yersinia frederiksenii]|nr:Uncharacterised protein [Yersinia frederiksenii]
MGFAGNTPDAHIYHSTIAQIIYLLPLLMSVNVT